MQRIRSKSVSEFYTPPKTKAPTTKTPVEEPIYLCIQSLANYQLKPSRKELLQQSFPDTKEGRLDQKIALLKNQDFPVKNDHELQKLFQSTRELKHQFPDQWGTHNLIIENQRYEIDIIPFIDNGQNRHEIIVSFPYPTNPEDKDLTKEIDIGTFKNVSYAWLIGKTARKVVRAVTYFNKEDPETSPTETPSQKEHTAKLRKKVSERETFYLNAFKDIQGFPEIYKSYHLIENLSPLKGKNILLMKAYWEDLYHTLDPSLTDYQKVDLVLKMFEPLEKLHEKGHYHGDVKLENYLIDEDNQVVLCDFGFASETTNAKEMDKGLGTLQFMSWERLFHYFKGFSLSAEEMLASDVWAAGQNALFALWNVQIPFPDEYRISAESLYRIRAALKILENAEPPASEPLAHLMWEMLQQDFTKRPTAQEAVSRLIKIRKSYEDSSCTLAQSTYWPEMQKELHKLFPVSEIENTSTP